MRRDRQRRWRPLVSVATTGQQIEPGEVAAGGNVHPRLSGRAGPFDDEPMRAKRRNSRGGNALDAQTHVAGKAGVPQRCHEALDRSMRLAGPIAEDQVLRAVHAIASIERCAGSAN